MAEEFIVKDAKIESHIAADRFRLTFVSERNAEVQVAIPAGQLVGFAELVLGKIGLNQVPTIDPRSLGPKEVYKCESFEVKPSPNGPVLQFGLVFSDGARSFLPFSFSDDEAVELIEMLKRAINRGG